METFVVPPNRVTGCLPRDDRVGENCPLASEKIKIIPQEEWEELIPDMALRPYCGETFDQDGVGSCSTEATAQAMQILRNWQNQPYAQLAPWSLYCFTSGGRDQGSVIGHNLKQARDVGILTMATWPRSKGWKTKPPQELLATEASRFQIEEYYDVTSILEIGSCLLSGKPVCFGWRGHSVVFTELVDENRARYHNSWGENWEDNGFGILRLNEVNFSYGAFAVASTTDARQ